MNYSRVPSILLLTCILAACGGGSSENAATPDAPTVSTVPTTPTTPSGNSDKPTTSTSLASCPASNINDIWLNNRLGCLTVGQPFIDVSSGATGTTSDRAFTIREFVVDSAFHGVLGTDVGRYFQYILCVRNAPSDLSSSTLYRQSLATDLIVAIGLRNSATTPPNFQAYADNSGGDRSAIVQQTCAPSIHPIIVNYTTKVIESINPTALSALNVYDL